MALVLPASFSKANCTCLCWALWAGRRWGLGKGSLQVDTHMRTSGVPSKASVHVSQPSILHALGRQTTVQEDLPGGALGLGGGEGDAAGEGEGAGLGELPGRPHWARLMAHQWRGVS